MQNFEQLERELERRGKTEELCRLAQSGEAQELRCMMDGDAVRRAAQSGDAAALKAMISRVLASEEGRRLAESVRKMMQD